MRISIITICLNNLEELRRTIDSVLGQTYEDYEFIVIDGGSTDGCRELIEATSRIDQWVSEPDSGIYNAMNKGVRMAHGDYFLFLNSGDTLYDRDVLRRVVPSLQGGDFYVGHSMLYENGEFTLRKTPLQMSVKFLFETSIMHQSTFIRGDLLRQKPYNEQYKVVSDWEYFFYEWMFNGRSYEPLDVVVSVFYLGGISNNAATLALNDRERQEVIDALIPKRLQAAVMGRDLAYFEGTEELERKIQKSMLLDPVQRDMKLLRNAFKFLVKDFFRRPPRKIIPAID